MSTTPDVSAMLREAEKHWCACVPVDTFNAIVNRSEYLSRQLAAVTAQRDQLREALAMADKWESDGRPDGIMHLVARLRAALAQNGGGA